MTILLIALLVLISLLIIGTLFARPLATFLQLHRISQVYEDEQILLWVGTLLTAFMIGLLVMYLLLRM
jgi:uncharacterized membrane protein